MAMYRAQHDAEVQAAVRMEEGRHCPLLVDNPQACLHCPENPFHRQGHSKPGDGQPIATWQELLTDAHYVTDLVELGMSRSLVDLSPAEFVAVRVLHHWRRQEQLRKQLEANGQLAQLAVEKVVGVKKG